MLKWGLRCQFYYTFSLHFMCWKYFNECFMDKNTLHMSLTNLTKNKAHLFTISVLKRTDLKSLISDFKNSFYIAFAVYLAFIFSTFSVYLWRVVYLHLFPYNFFWLRVKIMCSELYVLSRAYCILRNISQFAAWLRKLLFWLKTLVFCS